MIRVILLCISLFHIGFNTLAFATQPDPDLTPGVLCTEDDPGFSGYRYKENIPYCDRNITESEKAKVAEEYGVPKSDWSQYEFDHLLPLAIGGSNDIGNIWPQPKKEALKKDVVEEKAYIGLKNGSLTQTQAVQLIWDWIQNN